MARALSKSGSGSMYGPPVGINSSGSNASSIGMSQSGPGDAPAVEEEEEKVTNMAHAAKTGNRRRSPRFWRFFMVDLTGESLNSKRGCLPSIRNSLAHAGCTSDPASSPNRRPKDEP